MRAEYILEYQCPQCGAGVNLADTDRIFCCSYCKTKLVVVGHPHYSYYLKPSAKAPKDLIFVPYWRFKGSQWTLDARGVRSTLIDQTTCASSFPGVPQTLGIRSQTVMMKLIQPLTDGVFLDAQVDCNTARTKLFPSMSRQAELARALLSDESGGIPETQDLPALTAFSGEVISLIYAPYYVCNRILHDGVSLSALGAMSGAQPEMVDSRPKPPAFLSALCPLCGWDCLAERDSQALLCIKCSKAWIGRETALEPLEFQISPGYEPGDIPIPFWRFEACARRFPLRTYADLVRLTNLPRAILPGMENQKLFFWIPAFKSSPELFLRLAKLMTINQKSENCMSTLSEAEYYPVTLPAEEAFKAIPIVLGDLGPSRKALLPQLGDNPFGLVSCNLTYIPFASTRCELVEKRFKFAVQSNALKWARFL